jgi:hypothetical protein
MGQLHLSTLKLTNLVLQLLFFVSNTSSEKANGYSHTQKGQWLLTETKYIGNALSALAIMKLSVNIRHEI